eukprot:CAMPEP_0177601398 /NCGR_PEP_ID=MMETSP0419_2-20121207/14236_1 /TAXON_ID=582737 /ORGANISM="Tetraselmis sp., Strain GSL018" /LENGTH=33 /DNA_ID= /DNA_START= /DNA_END= /DNA_ORIENTATION=
MTNPDNGSSGRAQAELPLLDHQLWFQPDTGQTC